MRVFRITHIGRQLHASPEEKDIGGALEGENKIEEDKGLEISDDDISGLFVLPIDSDRLPPIKFASPKAKKEEIYNFDLKYEIFPQRGQLFSTTVFYKQINNPINLTQTRGSSGYFFYANTGEKATVFGLF